MQNRGQSVLHLIEAAQAMQAALTGECEHPSNSLLTQIPKTTGARQECLVCRKVRYQKWHGGPWAAWKER